MKVASMVELSSSHAYSSGTLANKDIVEINDVVMCTFIPIPFRLSILFEPEKHYPSSYDIWL